ncbi:serine/threonine-protein kinase RIO2 [Sporobolomyces koalae]|uniref:serine/threonine-protein kinase RIO2 n=1 Tax=Sporobolomyces koalae TaxID=500713 RepID=UPI003171D134
MKLDATDLRYISADAFRVLAAVEQGSKNHEVVPSPLIAQLSGARAGGVNKALGELAKKKLVAKVQNMKYEGYRLTYGGYDFLACRTFAKRDTIYSVGNQIGTGKESDIYVVADNDEEQMVMKIHRLGRMSFRAIKSKRDYLKKGQSASWMYMSRLAAIKEFAFMKVLYDHDFPVPKPIDQSRHCLIMELIDAFPLRQIASVPSPGALYSSLMDLIVRLARSGLIHGDFNEFNILILDHRTLAEKDRDDETTEERDARIARDGGIDKPVDVELEGEEYELRKQRERDGTLLEPVLIDFPQMVSTDHADAEYYFNRDVDCIRRFFRRRFKYESSVYPKFTSNLQNGVREFDLDVEVAASGFSKGERKVLEDYMAELAAHDKEHGSADEEEEYSDEEAASGDDVEDEDEDESRAEQENETEEQDRQEPLPSTSTSAATLKAQAVEGATDRFGNLLLSQPAESDDEDDSAEDDEDEEEEDEDEEDESSDGGASVAPSQAPRLRPKRQARDVSSIVSATLTRQQKSSERKHHGKKVASSNVLGRQKGSKKKASHNAAIKQGKRGDAFF